MRLIDSSRRLPGKYDELGRRIDKPRRKEVSSSDEASDLRDGVSSHWLQLPGGLGRLVPFFQEECGFRTSTFAKDCSGLGIPLLWESQLGSRSIRCTRLSQCRKPLCSTDFPGVEEDEEEGSGRQVRAAGVGLAVFASAETVQE